MDEPLPHRETSPRYSPLREYLSAFWDYFRARFTLFGLEAKDAGSHFGILGALAGGLVFLGIVGYLLLVLAIVFGISSLFDGSRAWMWGTLIAALFHFALIWVVLKMLKQRAKRGVFPETIKELKKDKQWLTSTSKN